VNIAVLRHAVDFAYGGTESGIPFLQNAVVSLFACGGSEHSSLATCGGEFICLWWH